MLSEDCHELLNRFIDGFPCSNRIIRAICALQEYDRDQPNLPAVVLISFVVELKLVSESLKIFSAF